MKKNTNKPMKKKQLKNAHATILRIFEETLGARKGSITPDTEYNSHPKWDSLKHLEIVARLEDAFKIEIDMDDVIAMNTVRKAEEIVAKLLKGFV
jgi:acyl carrier protein